MSDALTIVCVTGIVMLVWAMYVVLSTARKRTEREKDR